MTYPGPWPVTLTGWDRRSIWGYDEFERSWYAHLWDNKRPDDPVADAPHVTIGPPRLRTVADKRALAQQIAEATRRPLAEVDQMLAESVHM